MTFEPVQKANALQQSRGPINLQAAEIAKNKKTKQLLIVSQRQQQKKSPTHTKETAKQSLAEFCRSLVQNKQVSQDNNGKPTRPDERKKKKKQPEARAIKSATNKSKCNGTVMVNAKPSMSRCGQFDYLLVYSLGGFKNSGVIKKNLDI